MAELLKVNGSTLAPSEQIGRDLEWISVAITTGFLATNFPVGASTTYLDSVRQVVDNMASVTIVGELDLATPGTSDTAIIFGCEGVGGRGATEAVVGQPTDLEIAAQIKAEVEAIDGGALGTATVAFETIVGGAFV